MAGDVTKGYMQARSWTVQNLTVLGTLDAASINETVAINTNITTVGNGTLTAAALIGGIITRSGPVAAYTDTTATAAQIVAGITNPFVGQTLYVTIKNGVGFNQTLAAGSGVTLPTNNIIGPFMIGNYIMTLTSLTAVAFTHLGTNPLGTTNVIANPIITSLATVGAGTVSAAAINGGLISRSGSQSGTPFTDTTDTAANIIAGNTGLIGKIGESFILFYTNSTNAIATLTGGTGVTVSGITVVPVNMTVAYLLTYTAAATVTMVGIGLTNSLSTEMSLLGATSGQTTLKPAAISGASVLTLPAQAVGTVALSNPTPVAVGSSLAITAAMVNAPILLDTAAGSTATLPAATGTGNVYKFWVKTTATSNAHKILAASSSDFLNGIAVGHVSAGTTLSFSAAAATAHSIQMPFAGTQPSGGFIGDWFEFTDAATNLWEVKGMYQSGTTSATPFSAATS